ncbi:ABC transporter ATP-binding protein [Mesorhizobium sp. DCY119]|nr:ABC transporter ATP-binding protein [Mesorhizobium sp. DCY119]
MLDVRSLRIAYRGRNGEAIAVRDVSFQIFAGETVAVVGESGSGKTSVAQAIIGLLPPGGKVQSGSIRFLKTSLSSLTEQELGRFRGAQIGLVPQDPTISLNPVMRIGEQIAETLRRHGLADRQAARQEAVDILERVGIDLPTVRASQYPHELSGGMRQRVLIGIALACKPRLIIADEPTSALDVTVQRQILNTLEELTANSGTAVLLITHDLDVAADRADRIIVMKDGDIVETGETQQILRNARSPYTKRLIAAAPSRSSTRLIPRDAPYPACAEQLRRDEQLASATADINLALSLQSITKHFRVKLSNGRTEQVAAVKSVSVDIPKGSTLAIVGESGSGKTTTARMAARLVDADSGAIIIDGTDTTGLSGETLRKLRANVQMVYQNPYASFNPRFTVEAVIEEPLRAFGWKLGDRQRRVAELLDQVALPASAGKRLTAELSGGQRQRVAIARAIALKPSLIVLDEPVSALDVSIQSQVLQLLVDLQGELNLSYLFITHDLSVVRQVSDRVAVMRYGEIVEQGTTEAVFAHPDHEYTRELLEAIPGPGR